jgi:hypothetical protein
VPFSTLPRRSRCDGANRIYFRKEISVFLKLVPDAARAFLNHRIIEVPFALQRQQFALLFLA